MRRNDQAWWNKYESLDLCRGAASYLCDESEDMIEIRYDDGMMIDVGKVESNQIYYITVVFFDDKEGWKDPLYVLPIRHKEELYGRLQETILKFRIQESG